jgi:hypothetical protein
LATYQKRDANRFSKAYPYVRVPPTYKYTYNNIQETNLGEASVRTLTLTYNNESSQTGTFSTAFALLPNVSLGVSDDDVVAYITSLTTSQVTVETSAPFTGTIYVTAVVIS